MKNVGIYLFDDIELLDFAGPYEVFSVTAELNEYQLFHVFTISENGGTVQSVNGLKVLPDYSFANHPPIDILVIPGGAGTKIEMTKESVLAWIKEQNKTAEITMSVCSGTRLLGQIGLLDGLKIITHHEVIPDMQKISPKAVITSNVRFVDNGSILTSAGISSGIELSLHIVSRLYGKEIADKTTIYMEYGDWSSL